MDSKKMYIKKYFVNVNKFVEYMHPQANFVKLTKDWY